MLKEELVMDRLREGDSVLVHVDDKRKFLVILKPGSVLGTDKGFLRHDDIINKEYGDFVETSLGHRALLLKPLLIDYQHVIARRTQIIHPKDAAYMIYLSGIKPGSRVLEAGVGSGFLTISLANYVGSSGLVYGYDIELEHLEVARKNLERAGLIDRVDLRHGDVRGEVDLKDLDAVFYDLPDPWNALRTAYEALKPLSPLVAYVPTINQVERTVLAMRESSMFLDIHVYELLLREYRVEKDATRPRTTMIGHSGYIVFGRRNK